MPLTSPNLDDRRFAQLLGEAKSKITELCPDWTDRSPSDPGIVLLELFAYLTETLLYRLNRLPQKAYVEFLRLMGVSLRPPGAAAATLAFSKTAGAAVEIPRGTRVTTARVPGGGASPPVFATAEGVNLDAGVSQKEVLAYHCEEIEGELAAVATGLPGLSVNAKRPPIIARTGDGLDLLVGVETTPGDPRGSGRTIAYGSKTYRVWREVEHFSNLGTERNAYVADRAAGLIQFAPALRGAELDVGGPGVNALGEIPASGREIRLWYRRGGGIEGNVSPDTLTVMKDAITGVRVTNPQAAAGGRAVETMESALVRGPQELHSLDRAVTARDYELVALTQGGVSRAKAATKSALWRHATPGTVQVVLVPTVADEGQGATPVTSARLASLQSAEVLERTRAMLDERRPLGTSTEVAWVRTKSVRVRGQVVVHRGEDADAMRERLTRRLNAALSPVASPESPIETPGWRFGEPLRIAHAYVILQSEPGVRYAHDVALLVEDVPQQVTTVAADPFEPGVWYAGSGETVFRSMNRGDGWEPAGTFPKERVKLVRSHPHRPGLLAALTEADGGCRAHISWDCGERWESLAQTAFTAEDLAWIIREGMPVLLLATDVGLYELAVKPGSVPNQILVEPADQALGFYAIDVSVGALGGVSVAVAARGRAGVYLSTDGGRPKTFRNVGLKNEDVRMLAVQAEGPNSFLWAGIAAPGEVGKGCYRARLWETSGDELEWRAYSKGWDGGSCRTLAFTGSRVYAGTTFGGVARLDTSEGDPAWKTTDVASRLPILQLSRFVDIPAVAVDPAGTLRMVATERGVFRAKAGEEIYEACSESEFSDRVTLPPTWLFCSGEHEIGVALDRDL